MVDIYNLTNLTAGGNATTFLSFTQGVSSSVLGGNWMGYFIMLIVFSVFFFSIKGKGYFTATAFAVASWMVGLVAMLLRMMSLIDDWAWVMGLMLIPISLFVLFMAGSSMSD
jgi:hypothetical protein